MSAMELPLSLSLPLPFDEALPPTACWAGLIAVCIATIATISRLSPLPSCLMYKSPIRDFMSFSRQRRGVLAEEDACCAAREDEAEQEGHGQSREAPPSAEEKQKERTGEGANAGCSLQKTGEENQRSRMREEEEEGGGLSVAPSWVCSLSEAAAGMAKLAPLPASVEPPSICPSFPGLTRTCWSQALDARTSARLGKQWDIPNTGRLPLHQYNSSPFWASDSLLLQCSCQQRLLPQLFQSPAPLPASWVSLGFCSGSACVWSAENGMQANLSHDQDRPTPGLAALTCLNSPRSTMAAGRCSVWSQSSVVSFWDDRSAKQNMPDTANTPAPRVSLACQAFDICIAGGGFASLHDCRMLRDMAVCIYAQGRRCTLDVGGSGQSRQMQ